MLGFTDWRQRYTDCMRELGTAEEAESRVTGEMLRATSDYQESIDKLSTDLNKCRQELLDHYAAQANFVREVDARHRNEIQALHDRLMSMKIAQATQDYRPAAASMSPRMLAETMNEADTPLDLPDDGPPRESEPATVTSDFGAFGDQ